MLELDNISFRYPSITIQTVFCVERGQTVALMGGSGSGKTTILNLIAGFALPHGGDIIFDGNSLLTTKPALRPLTYLFQSNNLFPHLTVADNLAIGIDPGLRLNAKQRQKTKESLEWVSMAGFENRFPGELSGGQQQRVALGRCLLREKPILLLDEPFSALDQKLRNELIALIKRLQLEQNLCLVVATHQKQDAIAMGAEIVAVD